jgi:hypothetical protein
MPLVGLPHSTRIDDLDQRLAGLEEGEGPGQRGEQEVA